MEYLLLTQITIRHIGLLLSAISFGFQVGEKYILGTIQCPFIIISETHQLVRKLTFCFILLNIFTKKNREPVEGCDKVCLKVQLKRNLCKFHQGACISNTWSWTLFPNLGLESWVLLLT